MTCLICCANTQLIGRKVKTINVMPDNAKIIIGGMEVATGNYDLTMGKSDYIIVKLSAPGYIDKTVRVYKKDKNTTLTYKLDEDDSWLASDVNSDLANKTMRVNVKEGLSPDEVWKRITYYTTDAFPNMEITDKSSGWIRSAWNIQSFNYVTVRTRIEIKEIPGQDNITYRVMIQSEIAWKDCGLDDQCFKQWDRILKKYNQAVADLLNSLN